MDKASKGFQKRLAALALSLLFLLCSLPGALAVDLSVDAGFYFKQSRGGTCTLASAAMMLRRRAYLDGLDSWVDVTENGVRSSAWANGLRHSFTYNAMQVGYATLPSSTAEKTETLIALLAEHPEGIVLYDRRQPHAVLLTDYTDGVFYCSDPAGNISAGRVPISQASVSIAGASCYWYVCEDENSFAFASDGLRLEGVRYPVTRRTGSGMSLGGTACANAGAVLTEVEVLVTDIAGQTVQSASAAPNAESFSFRTLDSEIRFGTLAPGYYSYMILLTDSTGETLGFVSDFTVADGASSTGSYWSVKDAAGEKLLALEETAEPAPEPTTEEAAPAAASTGPLGWLSGLLGK